MPPVSPLLLRVKHAWIGVVISFLLFSASSQSKTSILLFGSCSPETAMKEPAASSSRRILFGGLLGRKENRRVCVCVKRGCENDFLQGRLVGLEPRVNHSSTLNCTMKQRWLEEVTKWPCLAACFHCFSWKGGYPRNWCSFLSPPTGGVKDAPHSGSVSCKKVNVNHLP